GDWGVDFLASLASNVSLGGQLSSLTLHEEDCDISISLAKKLVRHFENHVETRVARGITKLADVRLVFEHNRVRPDASILDELNATLRDLEIRGTKVAMFSILREPLRVGQKLLVLGSVSLATPSFLESVGEFVFD
ncbi:hypothetical protein V5O48_017980, partial [Marasmius crinis-equi]